MIATNRSNRVKPGPLYGLEHYDVSVLAQNPQSRLLMSYDPELIACPLLCQGDQKTYQLTPVGLSLGGNLGPVAKTLQSAIQAISSLPHVTDFQVSRFYNTAPVSSIPQPDYLNVACLLRTTYCAQQLLAELQTIEFFLGKMPKPKEAARHIDIDIIFFGLEKHNRPDLEIPHPRWQQRLFVVAPLSELLTHVYLPDGEQVHLNTLRHQLESTVAGRGCQVINC